MGRTRWPRQSPRRLAAADAGFCLNEPLLGDGRDLAGSQGRDGHEQKRRKHTGSQHALCSLKLAEHTGRRSVPQAEFRGASVPRRCRNSRAFQRLLPTRLTRARITRGATASIGVLDRALTHRGEMNCWLAWDRPNRPPGVRDQTSGELPVSGDRMQPAVICARSKLGRKALTSAQTRTFLVACPADRAPTRGSG